MKRKFINIYVISQFFGEGEKFDAYDVENKIDTYDAKVKVLIKSAKAVIIEPSLVKYDERLFRHMSFELVHMINIYLINGQSYIESDIIGFEPV